MIFTPKLCGTQDFSLRTLIGVGKQQRVAYLFQESSPEEAKANQVEICDMWHHILGHPSKGFMSLFSNKV